MTGYRTDQTLTLGAVELRVADLECSLSYYTQIAGFQELNRGARRAQLGVESTVPVDLREVPGAEAPPPSGPGLSHLAPHPSTTAAASDPV